MRASRPGESALLLLDVVDALAADHIGYAVIGALAASVHGAGRASMDADALLPIHPRELDRVKRLLERCGFHVDVNRGDPDDPISALLRVDDPHGNRVDLLVGLRGAPYELFSRVIEVPFQGTSLKFAGREDFIAMKAFAAGPLDLQDAACAIDAAGDELDKPLLHRIAAGFGRQTVEAVERLLASARQ